MTIYRGYDIKQRPDGTFQVLANGKPVDGHGGDWKSEDQAMDAIDARRRSRTAANLEPVGD